MKKLMIAAVVAFVAVASQAATVQWNITNVMDKSGDGQKAVSGIAYFFATENFSTASAAALSGKGATAVAAAMTDSGNFGQAWTVANGSQTTFTTSDRIAVSSMNLTEGGTYDFFAVIFDTATITDDSHFYVSTVKTGAKMGTGSANKIVSLGNQLDGTTLKGAWYDVKAAPEPTSGLLLLLGMAGLALKRKRA